MRLYHFMKEEYALKALINRRLKIALINELNDPFELLCMDLSDPKFRYAFGEVKRELSKKRGIVCFSCDYVYPVLWSHYADKHKGICLVFDVDDEISDGKVIYEIEKLKIPNDLMEKNEIEKEKFMERILTTKFKHWEYESEYRMFRGLDDEVGGMYFADFDEKLILKEIILGCCSTLNLDELYKYMGDLNGRVEISRAFTSATEFRIVKDFIK